jgi:hypothetical protein
MDLRVGEGLPAVVCLLVVVCPSAVGLWIRHLREDSRPGVLVGSSLVRLLRHVVATCMKMDACERDWLDCESGILR